MNKKQYRIYLEQYKYIIKYWDQYINQQNNDGNDGCDEYENKIYQKRIKRIIKKAG